MKNLFGSVALATLLFTVSGFAATNSNNSKIDLDNSNPIRGKKIYAEKFYKKCGITCEQMAKKYTQQEWRDFADKNKIQDAMEPYCSIMDELNPNEQRLIFDYMYFHAKGSGHVAACTD